MRIPFSSGRRPDLAATLALLAGGCAAPETVARTAVSHPPHEHAHQHELEDAEPGHATPTVAPDAAQGSGWFEPWSHQHYSPLGTPYVHAFQSEPAFLSRDLILDARSVRGDEEDEYELEAELEWAFTRRLGVAVGLPYRFLRPDEGDDEDGFGDLSVAPRALLVERDRFLLSANLEVVAPTGSEHRGLGGGETVLSPTATWWADLGGWLTWTGQFGTEHGLESGEDVLVYSTGPSYSFLTKPLFGEGHGHAHGADLHFPAGMVTLFAEYAGVTPLNQVDDLSSTGTILFGVGWFLTTNWELRAAAEYPAITPHEFDDSYLVGMIFHF